MSVSPFKDPNLWDTLRLRVDGQPYVVPGAVAIEVKGGVRADSVAVAGESGTQEDTFLGDGTSAVTVNVTLTTHEEYRTLVEIMRKIHLRNGKPPPRIDAIHPTLQLHRIRALYFTEFTKPAYTAREGFKITLFFTEYWEQKKSEVKPVGQTPADLDKNLTESGIPQAPGVTAPGAAPPPPSTTPVRPGAPAPGQTGPTQP